MTTCSDLYAPLRLRALKNPGPVPRLGTQNLTGELEPFVAT
ncbi:hypothetical protein SAMN05216202_3126 [Pseudomonas mucidolens]|uniref:Uncharacterized protein n=1 Tax=Pseudomonas mucidolens TaxID=46679 RepID=A0A1H2N797_9PSED|nr:hypothetical protein SAMN05216202_3126 [Pseudomonas mucidolens]SQH32517.1 Uncharacterised protein [Pseudomonas mucidolens]